MWKIETLYDFSIFYKIKLSVFSSYFLFYFFSHIKSSNSNSDVDNAVGETLPTKINGASTLSFFALRFPSTVQFPINSFTWKCVLAGWWGLIEEYRNGKFKVNFNIVTCKNLKLFVLYIKVFECVLGGGRQGGYRWMYSNWEWKWDGKSFLIVRVEEKNV